MDNKRLSKKRERKAAEDIGGKAHALSGAGWSLKGDLSNDMWLVEDKFTHEKQYSIQHTILQKVDKQSLKVGKLSALRFGFQGTNRNYAVVETKHLKNTNKTIMFTTEKNSILFKLEDLIRLANNNTLCEIVFEKQDKKYYILTWEYFVEIHKEV